MKRFVGLMIGQSPYGFPACVKIAFIKKAIFDKIDMDALKAVLDAKDSQFDKRVLNISTDDTTIFFSNKLFK